MTTIIQTNLSNPFHSGKVRDTYSLDENTLLMVATDRISAFDVVLPTGIPDKGAVLGQISAFWFDLTSHMIPNHMIALASDRPDLDIPPEIARRAMVIKKAQRLDVECVARGLITGSAWSEYKRSGTVQSHPMPEVLREGDPFPEVLFTPTTKAEIGHDENMSFDEVIDMVGADIANQLRDKTIEIFNFGREFAETKGIILADTKFEFGLIDDELILIDELLTPDSSRFWDAEGYAPGKSQPSYDKQFVRDWLDEAGWDHEPPAPELPADIVEKTRQRYLEAYSKLTGAALK